MPAPDQSEFYQALRGSKSIRLLHRTGIPNETPQFRLEEHDLKSCPPFVALSYTWNPPYFKDLDEPSNGGELSFSATIGIDSKLFEATQNMKDALNCALTKTKYEYVWMDQCCINQASVTERSSQVGLMHMIYEKADLVIIWLGGSHPYAASFQWVVNDFNSIIQRWIKKAGAEFVFSNPPDTIIEFEGGDRGRFNKRRVEAEHFYQLCRFFERTWVRQEVVLAKTLKIFCGDLQISPGGLTDLSNYFHTTSWVASLSFHRNGVEYRRATSFASFGFWFDVKEAFRKGTSSVICGDIMNPVLPYLHTFTAEAAAITGLWHIISRLQQSTCSDPRDKIYAALPLAMRMFRSAKVKMPIVPRYDLSVEQVYISFCVDTIRLTGSLHILTQVDAISERQLSLPSWVKDFSSKRTDNCSEMLRGDDYQRHVQLLGLRSTIRFKNDRLITFGTHFATITKKGSDQRVDTMYDYAQSLLRLIAAGPSHLDGVPRVEALWRTMLCDTGGEIKPSSSLDSRYAVSPAPDGTFHYFWSWILNDIIGTYEQKLNSGESPKQTLSWLVRLFLPFLDEIATSQLPSPIAILYWLRVRHRPRAADLPVLQEQKSTLSMFQTVARGHKERAMFLTKENFIGNGPLDLKIGDQIWFVHSCNMPLVFRPQGEQDRFSLVGPCYLHGFMRNIHMFDPSFDFVNKWRRFTLV